METQVMSYETLIRRAFNCPRQKKHGAQKEIMRNTMWAEQGKSCVASLGSFQKLFDKMRNHLSKALLKLAKTKPDSQSSELFILLEERLWHTTDTNGVMEIVNIALDETVKLQKELYI